MRNRMVKRLLAGCLAVTLIFGDTAGVLATELSGEGTSVAEVAESMKTMESTEVIEEVESTESSDIMEAAGDIERNELTESVEVTEIAEVTENFEIPETEQEDISVEQEQTVVTSEVTEPIYKAYFGLPSVLVPKQTASEASAWQGDRITNLGYRDGSTYDMESHTDTWKILDPSIGLLWADGIFMENSSSDMDTINAALDTYLNKVADNNVEAAKYDVIEKNAISEMRLLTKTELRTEAYGFHNTEDADVARKIGSYSYPINNDGTVAWVGTDGSLDGYGSNQGYAPAVVLDTSKVFMTIYSDFYEYGGYAKTDISDTTSRSWNLLLHSGDTGFAAALPETAPHNGYYYVDVTGLGSLSYDKISMVFVDSEGDIVAYVNSSYNEDTYDSDTYLSKPTEGSFQFSLPTDLAVGTYTVKVFCENEDGPYDTGYVSNIVEGTVEVQGPMASNISVEQLYGQVNLYWEIANKRTELFQTYTYCNIYRSVSRNGAYELVAANVPCDNSDASYYWMDRSVSKLEDSVENATYYYRIVTLSDSAECGGTEMVSSDVVTNEGLFYGVTGLESYIGAYIVNADGEKISALTIHEGEALELGLALVKPDGITEDVNSREMAEGTWYLHKEYSKTGECQNQEEVVADKLEICPYELVWEDGKIVLPAHKVYLQAGEDAEGLYYLTTEIKLQNGAVFDWQIPVTIIAAEEGIDYEKCPDIIVQTKEEAEQKLRDFMVARGNKSYVVVAPGVDIDQDSIFDIYAERDGMKPNEGDYLNYQVGYKDQTSFFWHPYESTGVEFNGHSYSAYYSTTPFITTAEEEAEVDAKINALVHTKGGALYEAAHGNTTDEEKVKAIYDWIVKNVNPSVAGDRTTPIYHTVYHTLFGAYGGYPGSGTCGAFAVLFTRLSREMGIASKVIMGTDAAAHAYNIVQIEEQWYYIDANTRRYLSGATEFERTQEQEHYLDQRFIDHYLSKISESAYVVEPKKTVELSYVDETGEKVVSSFIDFSEAVTAINNLKVKRDYTITLYEDCTVSAALTMPNKDYAASVTVIGAGIEGVSKIKSNGKLTLTSDTVFKNLIFDGTLAYAVAIGDYNLTIDENVNFASKVSFTGGKKGSLEVTEVGQLSDVISLKVTTFINKGEVTADTVNITDAYLDNGHLYTNKSLQITNLTLDGKAVLKSEKDFKITGTLYSKTSEAALYTRQNAKEVPYLNITGTVSLETLEDKVQIGVYADGADSLAKLSAGSMLLNVKTAEAKKFALVAENAGNVGVYPAENGYFLQKNKTGIYVYYAQDVSVALYKGDALLGYFASFADAVAEIEALKDTKAEYTVALLSDVNSRTNPAALTLPSKAAKVTITSLGEEAYGIFYTGNVTLKTHTEFVNVVFNPMDKNQKGVASKFAAGKFDLNLCDVEVGVVPGMEIKDITGSKTQVTTLASDGLIVTGNISGSKELVIAESVTVKGSIKVTDLIMQGGVALYTEGAVSVTDIYNNKNAAFAESQVNAVYYTKSSKGVSNLTVNGVIGGSNENELDLHFTNASKADYQLEMKSGKYTLNNKIALASMPKAALSEVVFYMGSKQLDDREIVKANKGVYVVDASTNSNIVRLQGSVDGIVTSSYCLDFAQAVNEINNAGSAEAVYEIVIGPLSGNSNVADTNTTDSKAVSAITMPKSGKAALVKISSEDGESITYSGNIVYPGVLEIANVVLAPTGACSISGTKNVSEVILSNTDAVFKDIKNVKSLVLQNSAVKTTGTVTVTDVAMSGASHWDTFGKVTVTDIDISALTAGSYVGVKQTAKTLVPMFTISGMVALNTDNTPLAVKLYQPTATEANPVEVTAYKNMKLVIAPKEDADRFVALPFTKENIAGNTEGITTANLVSYKSVKNEVANGNEEEMVIRIVQTHEGSQKEAETYAKSFDEAVTIINNLGDKTASYRMELLRGGLAEPMWTTKNGSTLGKMTLPSKAAEVTITGANENATVAIAYKGSLAANCDTIFDNVILLEGGMENPISVSYGGAYELQFTGRVRSDKDDAGVMMKSVKAAKGTLALNDAMVSVTDALTVKDIKVIGESALCVDGKAVITNIYGTGNENAKLTMDYDFSTKNATQVTVNGNISDVELQLVPNFYDKENGSYYPVDENNAVGKQFVIMPKASIAGVTVGYCDERGDVKALAGGSLYKQNGGLYYTTEPLLVEVVAEDESGKAALQIYRSYFLSWDYAVKEIDKRADASLIYRMILKEDIITNLTLPTKAKEVVVTSESGEENSIYFTKNKVTLKTNTTFDNVGLFAVKKVSGDVYDSISYNIAAGKFNLTWKDVTYVSPEGIQRKVGTISGNGKGTFTALLGSEERNNVFVVDMVSKFGTVNIYNEVQSDIVLENQVVNSGLITKGMSGISTLNLYPGTVVSCDAGSVSAKNGTIRGSVLYAKDITISQEVLLESARLEAGSETVGDGKLSLGNVLVEDTNNYLEAKLSKTGKTQLSISGTVAAAPYYTGAEGASAIEVALLAKDGSVFVTLVEGLDVINAAKAEAFWFVPRYTSYESEGMGWYDAAYCLYNTAKTIKYGSVGR